MNKILFVPAIALLFAACGASPESAGKAIAEQQCECEKARLKLGVKVMERLLDDLEDGDIADRLSLNQKMMEVQGEVQKLNNTCEKEAVELEAKYEEKFMRPDDRETIHNAQRVHAEKCQRDLEDDRHDAEDEIRKIQREMEKVVRDKGL